jgi:hypothetical protein
MRKRCFEADQRQTISLAFFTGSHLEVRLSGQTTCSAKTHIRRGLLKLKNCLDDHAHMPQ